jgi:hypothetical protein
MVALGLTVAFITWIINPYAFNQLNFDYSNRSKSIFNIEFAKEKYIYKTVKYMDETGKVKCTMEQDENAKNKVFFLNDLYKIFVFIMYFQSIILLLLSICGLKAFLKIVTILKNDEPFSIIKINALRKIGFYAIAYFFVSSFCIFIGQNVHFWSINVNITALSIAILSFIFAEIFKEGHAIQEEAIYTI